MRGVTKSFGYKQVLRGIDIEVAAEESLAIIGTSVAVTVADTAFVSELVS